MATRELNAGKTTFINALVNNLHYGSFQDAMKSRLILLAPALISLVNDENDTIAIPVGTQDHQHRFGVAGTLTITVTFTDSLGIADPSEAERDMFNIENILRYLSSLPELHTIYFLPNPNTSRNNEQQPMLDVSQLIVGNIVLLPKQKSDLVNSLPASKERPKGNTQQFTRLDLNNDKTRPLKPQVSNLTSNARTSCAPEQKRPADQEVSDYKNDLQKISQALLQYNSDNFTFTTRSDQYVKKSQQLQHLRTHLQKIPDINDDISNQKQRINGEISNAMNKLSGAAKQNEEKADCLRELLRTEEKVNATRTSQLDYQKKKSILAECVSSLNLIGLVDSEVLTKKEEVANKIHKFEQEFVAEESRNDLWSMRNVLNQHKVYAERFTGSNTSELYKKKRQEISDLAGYGVQIPNEQHRQSFYKEISQVIDILDTNANKHEIEQCLEQLNKIYAQI